jgi:hypothetical protein
VDIKQLRNKLEQQKGKKLEVENTVSTLQIDLQEKKRDLRRHEQAREIIKEVGQKTQNQLSLHISDITSMALEAVFPEPYELQVEFVQRRNKTECDLYFTRERNKVKPMEASGIGAVDVAAFALRIASWTMQIPHTSPVFLLDEPFKHLKEISKRMGIQMLMISDERIPREDIIEAADKVFEISIKNKISKVKVL